MSDLLAGMYSLVYVTGSLILSSGIKPLTCSPYNLWLDTTFVLDVIVEILSLAGSCLTCNRSAISFRIKVVLLCVEQGIHQNFFLRISCCWHVHRKDWRREYFSSAEWLCWRLLAASLDGYRVAQAFFLQTLGSPGCFGEFWVLGFSTFTFSHLTDALIQSDLQ